MDSNLMILIFSFGMFFGSYIAGTVPLLVGFSNFKVHRMTVYGAGLLIGTALAVIIPEGIQMLLHAANEQHSKPLAGPNASPKGTSIDHDSQHEQHETPLIGFSLILGFVFMLFVDHFSRLLQSKNCSSEGNSSVASTSSDSASVTVEAARSRAESREAALVTMLGLVVHAAADGVALGAALTTNQLNLEILVFVAIMLHKAPASFGLVSFLMHENLERTRIRRYLLVFCAAAPILAIFTYAVLSLYPSSSANSGNGLATGVTMLFSAGTFLYVSTVHVLPEVCAAPAGSCPDGPSSSQPANTASTHSHSSANSLTGSDTILLTCGALTPVLLTYFSGGHGH